MALPPPPSASGRTDLPNGLNESYVNLQSRPSETAPVEPPVIYETISFRLTPIPQLGGNIALAGIVNEKVIAYVVGNIIYGPGGAPIHHELQNELRPILTKGKVDLHFKRDKSKGHLLSVFNSNLYGSQKEDIRYERASLDREFGWFIFKKMDEKVKCAASFEKCILRYTPPILEFVGGRLPTLFAMGVVLGRELKLLEKVPMGPIVEVAPTPASPQRTIPNQEIIAPRVQQIMYA